MKRKMLTVLAALLLSYGSAQVFHDVEFGDSCQTVSEKLEDVLTVVYGDPCKEATFGDWYEVKGFSVALVDLNIPTTTISAAFELLGVEIGVEFDFVDDRLVYVVFKGRDGLPTVYQTFISKYGEPKGYAVHNGKESYVWNPGIYFTRGLLGMRFTEAHLIDYEWYTSLFKDAF